MVVLYGSLLFIFVYLTYLTGKSRDKSREIKRLKLVSKEYRLEIASLKAQINGKAETKTDEAIEARTNAIYTDGNGESEPAAASNPRWWKVRQSF